MNAAAEEMGEIASDVRILKWAWAPPLPAQRGPAEEPVIRAVQHRTLTAVGVDAKLEVQTLPVEHPEPENELGSEIGLLPGPAVTPRMQVDRTSAPVT